MFPRHRAWRWLLILCAAVFLWGVVRYAGHELDDTFISFRYARNLVEGHGLVFNPGERVEGYTNLLFVLISAAFIAAGIDPLAGSMVVTALSALAALMAAAALVREVMESSGADLATSRRCAVVTMAVLLTSEGFAYWAVVGMETMLFAALLTVASLLLIVESRNERGHLSGVFLILLALTRPEGAFAAAIALAAALLMERARDGERRWSCRGARRVAVTAVIAGGGVAVLLIWRFIYYGSLLPNTFYAKVTGGAGQLLTGLHYLGGWAIASPAAALALAAPLALLSPKARARIGPGSPLWLLFAIVAALVVNIVAVGGDSMPFFRFFMHVMPIAVVVAVIAGERALNVRPRGPALAALALAASILASAVASHATIQPYRAFVAHRTAVVGAAVGRWFSEALPPGSLMAVNTIGTLPWESGLPTIDMLGLADPVIAHRPVYVASTGWAGHRRGWGAYVMSRRPAAILWYNSAGSADPFYLGDRELAADPWFRFYYRHRVRVLPSLGGEESGVGLAEARGLRSNRIPERYDESGSTEPAAGRVETHGEEARVPPERVRAPGDAAPAAGAAVGDDEEEGSPAPAGDGGAKEGWPGRSPAGSERGPRRPAGGSVIARFPGRPFGYSESGLIVAPELGLTATFAESVISWTEFHEGPITVNWFEPDPRDTGLWPMRQRFAGDVDGFVDAVAALWRRQGTGDRPFDPELRARVEAMCDEAAARVEAGDLDGARRILLEAMHPNERGRSPRLFQYMANVAVMTGDLLVAFPSQKEALRLAPGNRLYTENLKRLLKQEWIDPGSKPGRRAQ